MELFWANVENNVIEPGRKVQLSRTFLIDTLWLCSCGSYKPLPPGISQGQFVSVTDLIHGSTLAKNVPVIRPTTASSLFKMHECPAVWWQLSDCSATNRSLSLWEITIDLIPPSV